MYRKRILNKQEERTHDILNDITKKYEARLFTKNRVADLLLIENSGLSDNEYSYALKAHFDFVIADKDYMPEFAIEFDGSQHRFNKSAIRKDELKNSICRKLDFSLLRITSEYFEKIGRFPTILSWITELHFIKKAFDIAQSKGQIPFDEPWLWFSVYDYDPVDYNRAFIKNAYNKSLCCDDTMEFIYGISDGNNSSASISILKLQNDKYLANYVECSSINFYAVPARDIARGISDHNTLKQFKKYIEGNNVSTYTHAEILKMKNDFLKQHDFCSYFLKLEE